MVLLVQVRGERLYACEECGLIYESRATAEACEAYCRAHKACNPQIAAKAVGGVRRLARGLRLE